jgi:L-asparaginase / beta-aspartyl-peptidase
VFSHWSVESADRRFVVQVHGGAWNIPQGLKQAHIDGVRLAYVSALRMLSTEVRPLEAVVGTLMLLENDPTFDAGTGSFLNEDGRVELDAAVMEGATLRAGAVASLASFANPSAVALAVMEKTEHVLLIAEGAERFAREAGFTPVEPASLVNERERTGYEAWVAAGKPDARTFFDEEGRVETGTGGPGSGATSTPHEQRGTVGVVIGVRRSSGRGYALYAGASTGGTRGKKAGRVGDVPLVGSGIYADDEGAAVCCTGWGEAFIRMAAAKAVSERAGRGEHPQQAVEKVLRAIHRRTGGRGGIMAIDGRGRMGAAFTTPDMGYAGPSCQHIVV